MIAENLNEKDPESRADNKIREALAALTDSRWALSELGANHDSLRSNLAAAERDVKTLRTHLEAATRIIHEEICNDSEPIWDCDDCFPEMSLCQVPAPPNPTKDGG